MHTLDELYIIRTIDGVPFVVRKDMEIPYEKLKDFPNCCGAGQGFWERIVPERIWFLRISAACYFHDIEMEMTEPSQAGFDRMNYIFLLNTLSIINFKSRSGLLKGLRRYRAITFYNAVNSTMALEKVFWKLKKEQKEMGQWVETSLSYIIGKGRESK